MPIQRNLDCNDCMQTYNGTLDLHIATSISLVNAKLIQDLFHVYLNKFEIAVSHLSLIIFSNNKFTLVN